MRVARPGAVLEKELEERGWSVEDFAERSGLELDLVEKLLDDSRVMTRAISEAIGEALGTSANLWYQLSRNWRWWVRDTPPEAAGWLTPELRQALEAIEKPHVAKKRATVLLLASATANEVAWRDVFEDPRCCNQRIWYQKWQHDKAITRALELATEQALLYRDTETAKVEAAKLQELRRALASGSVDAVEGMRLTAKQLRDRAGTEAAMKLIAMFAPDIAAPAQEDGQGVPIDVRGSLELEGLSDLGDEELDALIANLAAATGVAGGEPDHEG